MLEDTTAQKIISRARQKNVAAKNRGSKDFDHIFADFFASHHFDGQRILDLGPGQYDFARRVRDAGGIVDNIDKDPAVVELGRYLGFEVFEEDLRRLDLTGREGVYDGLFCKFSVNAFWHDNCEEVRTHIATLDRLLKPDGWGWIAPWNGVPKAAPSAEEQQAILTAQRDEFEAQGWTTCLLSANDTASYGINGRVANNVVFVKRLSIPSSLKRAA